MSNHWSNPVAQELLDRREREVADCVREQALREPERHATRLRVSTLARIKRLLMRRPSTSIADAETGVPVQPRTSASEPSRPAERLPEEVRA
jgi:hypothetical protein